MKLVFQNLSAAYRKNAVLEDISFQIPAGSITAVTGANGAGKSTLLRCLTGEKRDYRGEIFLDGRNIRPLTAVERARLISCLPQELPCPHVTVEELVGLGRIPYTHWTGSLSPADRETVNKALLATGMQPWKDAFVDTLSGGQRKKAFFAMVLAQNTPLVLLDEPTAHLDTASRFAFLELVEQLRRDTGKTFLLVIHELPEMLSCADQILVLSDRKLVFDGNGPDFLSGQIPQTYFHVDISGNRQEGFALRPLEKPECGRSL